MPPSFETPSGETELVALVRDASQSRRPLWTEGSGTKRHVGPAAHPEASMVSLRRLDDIVSYDPDNRVVCVQAGARLADVQRVLAERGQWLPIDPPFSEATIGGVVATRSFGPRRLGYGTPRDLLLGTRVVTADGEIAASGGRVVKNVSGYDLHRLQVGAFGTLGVLLEANLRASTRPEASALLVDVQSDLQAAHRLLLGVDASSLRPCTLEAVDGAAVPEIPSRRPDAGALAIVGVEGSRANVQRQVRELMQGAWHGAILVEGPRAETTWQALAALSGRDASAVVVRVGAAPHVLPDLLRSLPPLAVRTAATVVHAGIGIARLFLADVGDTTRIARLVAAWQPIARERRGYAVVDSAPLALTNRSALPWNAGTPDELGLRLKRALDPRGILNPGRMAW